MNYIKDANNCWTVVVESKVFTFDVNHINYLQLLDCIKKNDEATFLTHVNVGQAIQNWSKNGFTFTDGILTYLGDEVAPEITAIVLDMVENGFNEVPILNFMKRLFANPSNRAVKELYSWLAHKSLAICEDGTFLAYKSVLQHCGISFVDSCGRQVVMGDYVDKFSQTVRNNVGDVNEMPRRKVNDDFQIGCSEGFHVGSLKYVTHVYGSPHQIICKIDPADVVSVPLECDCQKLRCCKYEVVSEFKNLKIVEVSESKD